MSAPSSNTDVLDLITFMASSPSMDEVAQHLVLNTLESFKPRSVLISSFETDGNLRTSGSFGMQVEVSQSGNSQSLWDRTPSTDAVRLSRPLHFASAAELQAAYSNLPAAAGLAVPMVAWPLVLGQTRLGSVQLHFAELPEEPAFTEEMTNVAAVLGLYMGLITPRGVRSLNHRELSPAPSLNGNRDLQNSNHNDPVHALTARQTRILHLLADGLTNPQIAARIGFSDSTVRQETMAIYRFLGASGRREASRLAALRGLLSEESDILNDSSLNFA